MDSRQNLINYDGYSFTLMANSGSIVSSRPLPPTRMVGHIGHHPLPRPRSYALRRTLTGPPITVSSIRLISVIIYCYCYNTFIVQFMCVECQKKWCSLQIKPQHDYTNTTHITSWNRATFSGKEQLKARKIPKISGQGSYLAPRSSSRQFCSYILFRTYI